jgi:hypothetical protein
MRVEAEAKVAANPWLSSVGELNERGCAREVFKLCGDDIVAV